MGQRERFIIFLVGSLLGVMLLLGSKSCGAEQKQQRRKVREGLSMAPMMYDYAVQQKGFYGKYVLYEKVVSQPDGSKIRTLVTGGTRRYTPDGHELPEEHILIRETYAASVPLTEAGPVLAYEFSFADRVAIKIKPGYQDFEVKLPSGDVATAWPGHKESLIHLNAWRKQTGGAPWGELEDTLRKLNAHPAVEEARLVRINWQTEAELIKANSGK